MEQRIKDDILAVLDRAIEILRVREEKDVLELSELSDHTIHNAATYQDPDSITTAVLIYAIYKVIERPSRLEDEFYKQMESATVYARSCLVKEELEEFRKGIDRCFKIISNIDKRLQMFVQEVITKARIKKGGKIFEHGISIGRAAELMGLSQWQLTDYVGRTQIMEKEKFVNDVKSRVKFTRGLFRK